MHVACRNEIMDKFRLPCDTQASIANLFLDASQHDTYSRPACVLPTPLRDNLARLVEGTRGVVPMRRRPIHEPQIFGRPLDEQQAALKEDFPLRPFVTSASDH